MSVRENLIAARALIADEAAWAQGKDVDASKGRYCAAVACNDFPDAYAMFNALGDALPEASKRPGWHGVARIFKFNDESSHAEVVALFDRAIAAQPEGEAP
jgi:hypothetical protein